MAKQVQINVSFTSEQAERLERWQQRYNKQTNGQILREIFDLYADLYEQAEEAKRLVVLDQLGKAQTSAPAHPHKQRRA